METFFLGILAHVIFGCHTGPEKVISSESLNE